MIWHRRQISKPTDCEEVGFETRLSLVDVQHYWKLLIGYKHLHIKSQSCFIVERQITYKRLKSTKVEFHSTAKVIGLIFNPINFITPDKHFKECGPLNETQPSGNTKK